MLVNPAAMAIPKPLPSNRHSKNIFMISSIVAFMAVACWLVAAFCFFKAWDTRRMDAAKYRAWQAGLRDAKYMENATPPSAEPDAVPLPPSS